MNLLLEIHDSDIFPSSQNLDPSSFSKRETARAVIINGFGQIALLNVGRYNYHKLPGGGVEAGEDIHQALQRELLEEIGCRARIMAEIGVIIEYKSEQMRKQTSYCYLGEQVGEALPPRFTNGELANGYTKVWSDNIDSAIILLENDRPIEYTRKFIQTRELAFLRAAKPLIEF